jgi:hypothetical protein
LAKGMAEQAVKETRAMLHSLGLDEIGDAAEKAFSESGLKGALEVLVREFSSDAFPYPSVHGELASLWVKLEDHDKALAHLEQAYQDREQEFPLVAVKPDLDPLHSDPRFRDLLNRIGLKTS